MNDNEKPMTVIEGFFENLLDISETKLESSPDALGFKAHVGDLFSREDSDGNIAHVFLQIYTQCDLSMAPKDRGLGFVETDMNCHSGILIAEVDHQHMDPPVYVGEILTPDDFFVDFPVSDAIRGLVDKEITKQKIMTTPQESFYGQASTMYNDRLPGRTGLIKERVYC